MRAAVAELGRVAPVVRTSRVYATAPVGPPQPAFLNAAALVTYAGAPDQLLDAALDIEARLGRVRRDKWGPRVIDLDLLWAAEQPASGRDLSPADARPTAVVVDTTRLALPHPRLPERAFALAPMLELVPDAVDPRSGRRYVVPAGHVRVTADVL